MKKILMAAAIAGAFVAAPASAQWYAGAGIGAGRAKGSINSSSGAISATAQSNSDYDTSGKIFGGYQITPNWGVEVQYAYLGKFNYNITTNAPGVSGNGSYKAESWGVAATGTLPLANNFYLFGKLGAAFNKVKDSGFTVSGPGGSASGNIGTSNKTDLLAGLGAGYNFNPKLGIRVEYENFGKMAKDNGANIKGENWAVSLKYSF